MHCELVIPGLFSAPRELRLPALELLLARGRSSSATPLTLERWLLDAFELDEDAPLAAGALTVLGDGGEPGDALWARADPVHLRLMRENVVLLPSAAFSVSRDEAEALCETINRHFTGVLTLHPLHAERWCARMEEALVPRAGSPLELAGRDVDANLPQGPQAKRLHALLNEIQMLLHQHPVNEAREARGEPIVNSVWLWGGGRVPAAAHSRWQSVAAEEPLARGLARLAGTRARALAASANAWLDTLPEEGRHLAVLDQLRAPLALEDAEVSAERLRGLEQQWFAPLLAQLREGRIGMVTLQLADASGGSYETIRSDLRRFWRRPRPLERYA